MEFLFPILALLLSVTMVAFIDLLVYAALALTAASTVYSYQATQKAAKDQLKSGGVEITRQDSNAGLTIIYGERAVGGVKVWKDVQRTTFAINAGRTVFGQGDATDGVGKTYQLNAWLNRVDVLGQGPIEGITNIEIEDDSYQAPRFRKRNHAIYRGVLMDGSDTQSNLTELASNSDWKASSVGTGVAYMYSRFRAGHLDDNKIDRYYSAEPSMRYHVKGRRIWDPRDVSQSSSDPSTWLWSDNPALCLLDYLTQSYGRNLDYAQLDIDSFKTAADSCDIAVAVPTTANETGSVLNVWDPELGGYVDVQIGAVIPNFRVHQLNATQKRLTCNAALDPSNSVLENVKILLQSMRGTLPYHNGTYSLKLEDTTATSMSVTEDDIIGGISIANGDRSKRFNRTTVIFKNRNKKYKEDRVSWPQLDSAEYATLLAEDNNEELFFEVGLDAVTDYYQAEDLAEFITLSSREQLAASMKIKSKGMLLEPADVIEVTHQTPGWSARKFRVRSVKVNTDQTVDLSLTEYNASTYTWRETSQEPVQEDIGLASPFDDKLPVTGLAAVITRTDTASGVPQGLVDLTFTAPVGESVREYIVRFKPTGTAVWIENLYPPTQDETTDLVSVQFLAPQHDTTYDLEVNYLDAGGVSGEAAVASFTVPQYRTDLDVDLNTIETEVGEILERDDGLGEFIPSDLSDLAYYYKNSELTLQGNIDTAQASLDADVANLESSIASTNSTVSTLSATVTSEVARLDTSVDGINTLIDDISAATSDVYVQVSAPVAGVGGVPDPLATNSRWYDSDDSNHPYVWDGTAWVSIRDGQVGVNEAAITALQVDLTTAEGDITANAGAITSLDATITTLNGTVSSNSSDITNLTSSLATTDGSVSANSTAISALDVRTTAAEGSISTNATDITTLETTTATQSGDITANATAISALDVRTTANEGTLTTQASDITQLGLDLATTDGNVTGNATAISGLDTRITTAEGALVSQASDITALESTTTSISGTVLTNASAISGLETRVSVTEDTINLSQAADIASLQADLIFRSELKDEGTGDLEVETGDIIELENDASGIVAASSRADRILDTRVTQSENSIVAQASDITQLQVDVVDNALNISGNASALSALTTTVTQNGADITANSSDITSLQSDLTAAEGSIAATSTALNALDTRVTSAEGEITSNASDITSLTVSVADNATANTANGVAISGLDTRVTSAEGSIVSNSSLITSLTSSLVNTNADVTTNATAISGLTTTASDLAGDILANAADITSLETTVNHPTSGVAALNTASSALSTRVTATEGSISTNSSNITNLTSNLALTDGNVSGNATAISGLDTRVSSAEGSISSQASDISSLQSGLSSANGNISGNSTAIGGLDTRVTSAEGSISSQASDISSLQSGLSTTNGNVSGNSTAIGGLDTRVTSAEGSISSQSSSITSLQSSVTTAEGNITNNASAVSGLTTRVTTTEGDITSLEAQYYVNLDVDGHVTGIRLYNTGATSGFTVQADQFTVVAPGASSTAAAPFSVNTAGTITMNASVEINGNLLVDGTITQTQMGNNSVGGNQIINGSVSANELEISANTGGTGERMFFNGSDNRIEIFDASNVLRVALGDLTGV